MILSNQSWKMVMDNCEGAVLSSGDVKLLSIKNPIPVRQAPPIKLDSRIEEPLSAYIPAAILSKMGGELSSKLEERRSNPCSPDNTTDRDIAFAHFRITRDRVRSDVEPWAPRVGQLGRAVGVRSTDNLHDLLLPCCGGKRRGYQCHGRRAIVQ